MFCCRALIFIMRSEKFIVLDRVWKLKCIITDTRFICISLRICEYPFIGRRAVDRSSIYVFSALIFPYSISFRMGQLIFRVVHFFKQVVVEDVENQKKIVTWHQNQIYTSFFISTFFLRSISIIYRCSTVQDTLLDEMKTLG